MIVSALLLGYALLACRWLVPALQGAGWTGRAPRMAVTGWICLAGSLVSAVLFACLAPLVPLLLLAWEPGLLAWEPGLSSTPVPLDLLWRGLLDGAGPSNQFWVLLFGLAVAAAVVLRVVLAFAAAGYRTRRQCGRHEEIVAMVGRRLEGVEPPVMVLDHWHPAAYCLPGRRTRIVVTTTTLRTLTDDQLSAVLAHERAHLYGRHHLLATTAHAFGALLPRSRALAIVRTEILRLLELLADDAAARTVDRLVLAEAVLTLAATQGTGPDPLRIPGVALAAANSVAAQRVRRLLGPHAPLGRGPSAGVVAGSVITALTPLAMLLGPAPIDACAPYCTSLGALLGLLGHA